MPDAAPDEFPTVLLRRVPPREGGPSAERTGSGELRPSSDRMTVREGEEYLSCFALDAVAPLDLLRAEAARRSEGGDAVSPDDLLTDGWRVCVFAVADMRAVADPAGGGMLTLRLEELKEIGALPGHWGVYGADGGPFPNRVKRKLAKLAFVLAVPQTRAITAGRRTAEEIDAMRRASAGDAGAT